MTPDEARIVAVYCGALVTELDAGGCNHRFVFDAHATDANGKLWGMLDAGYLTPFGIERATPESIAAHVWLKRRHLLRSLNVNDN